MYVVYAKLLMNNVCFIVIKVTQDQLEEIENGGRQGSGEVTLHYAAKMEANKDLRERGMICGCPIREDTADKIKQVMLCIDVIIFLD